MPDDSTTALVLDAQRGDTWAQDRLVAHHLPLVYNIAGRALGGGHADIDDIVQDTFIRALSHLPQLREPECFRAWLVTITTNRIRDHWRAVQAAEAVREPIDDGTEPVDAGSDFADLTILRLGLTGQRAEVAEATRWMDEDDRTLLSLWWQEAAGRLSRADVAEAMGLSPQHTAVRVQRMKERLECSRGLVRALAHAPRCPALDELTGRWDGVPSPLWRKRLSRHITTCAECQAGNRGLVPAEGLLMGLALVPVGVGLLGLLKRVPPTAAMDTVAYAQPSDAPRAGAGPRGDSSAAGDSPASGRLPAGGDTPAAEAKRLLPRSSADSARPWRARTPLLVTALVLLVGAGGTALSAWDPSPAPSPSRTLAKSAGMGLAPARPVLPAPAPAPQIGEAASGTATPRPSTPTRVTPTAVTSPTKTPARSASPTARPAPRPPTGSERMLNLVNAERAQAGCAPVRADRKLTKAAQEHSDDMIAHDYFAHTDPQGRDSGDRIEAAGYDADGYNENISGWDGAEDAVKNWMTSGGHREAILDCDHEDAGIGYAADADGDALWTLLLAHT
ncbi:sigma-70 family RNA polymerase sigma factor [Streptomyces sp. NPDC004288]